MWILFLAAALALQLYANALSFYGGSSANWWPYDVLDWFRYLGVMGLGAAAVLSLFKIRWTRAVAASAAACGLYWFVSVETGLPVGSWQHWNDIAPEEKTWRVTLPMFVVLLAVTALAAAVWKTPRFAAAAGLVSLTG